MIAACLDSRINCFSPFPFLVHFLGNFLVYDQDRGKMNSKNYSASLEKIDRDSLAAGFVLLDADFFSDAKVPWQIKDSPLFYFEELTGLKCGM